MKYYLIAGETSGDKHGAKLIGAISALDSQAQFRGIGGVAMRAAGMDCFYASDRLGSIGFAKVSVKYKRFFCDFALTRKRYCYLRASYSNIYRFFGI